MKKDFFKKNLDGSDLLPNFLVSLHDNLAGFFINSKIKYVAPLLIISVIVSLAVVDRSLGIFLGITNSINLLGESLGESSGSGSIGYLQICKTIGKTITKIISWIMSLCKTIG